MAVSGRLALVAALLTPVLWLRPGPVTVAGLVLVLAALIGVDLLGAASVARLRINRHPDSDTTVRLTEPATVALVVTNPTRRRLRGRLRDGWAPSAGAVHDRHRLDLAPGESTVLTTELVPTRRGERVAHSVTVHSFGPLGLAARTGRRPGEGQLRVLPAFASRRHLPERLARLRELDGNTPLLIRGEGTDLDSLREYVPGDDVRAIDWRATARAADVMVRTWRPERDRHILLVLDTGRTSAGRIGDAPRLDTSLDAALLLAVLADRAGDRVDLLAHDRRVRASVRGRTGAGLLPALTAAMTELEPELVETDARGLVGAVLARARRRTLIVLFTTLDPEALSAGLLPVLPALTARHKVIVASVADPWLDTAAGQRHDTTAVYTAAAAERALAERRRLAEELRRQGVTVLDAAPEELAPQLADAYLAVKAAPVR